MLCADANVSVHVVKTAYPIILMYKCSKKIMAPNVKYVLDPLLSSDGKPTEPLGRNEPIFV